MQFKQWFDQRAEKGQHHTIRLVVERSHDINTWQDIVSIKYEPVQLIHADRDSVSMYGCMTQEEAIAMAKLLYATT